MKNALQLLTILACAVLTGCGGYDLQGKVVNGPMSMMTFVDAGDSRLADDQGVSNARINIHRDPRTAGSAQAGSAVSGPDGRFTIPLDQFGAGWMEEEWLIEAARPGFGNATELLRLPSQRRGMHLLIMLAPGVETRQRSDEDLMKLYERFR